MTGANHQAEQAVARLLQSDESQLFAQLGIRARAQTIDPSTAGSYEPTVVYDGTMMGPMDDVKQLGMRIFRRWNIEAYGLVCGSGDADEDDRRALLGAFNLGDAAVAAVVAGILVTYGAAPAIAAVVAAIIVKRFFRPAYEEFCVTWKEKLPTADDQ